MSVFTLPAFLSDWLNRRSIATKITLAFSILVLGASLLVGFLVYSGNSRLVISRSKERLKPTSQALSAELSTAIKNTQNDIRLIAQNPVFEQFTRQLQQPGTPAGLNGKAYPDVSNLFRSLLESRPDYLQVSFLSARENKKELIRLNQEKGRIQAVPAHRLSRVEGLLYFDEVGSLVPEQVYISSIGLFRKNGELAYPLTPSIKTSMPVFDAEQQLLGILLITLDLTPTFNHLQNLTDQQATLYLTNNAGDYLIHPDPKKTFGFEHGTRWLLQHEFPESRELLFGRRLALQFDEAQQNQAGTALLNLEKMYVFNDYRRFLVLGISVPYDSLLAGLKEVRNESLLLTLAICAAGMLLAQVFSRFLVRPLQDMTTAVANFPTGQAPLALPQNRYDEIGILAQAFNRMAAQIQAQLQELADKEQGIRAIIETTNQAIVLIDASGAIERVNPAAEIIFGYPDGQLIGRPIQHILTNPADAALWAAMAPGALRPIPEGQGWETTATRRDGRQIHVFLALSAYEIGGAVKYTGIIHDISTRKQVEAELLAAKQQAEEANRAKDEFLSIMSHEIRTPLNAVIGMTQLLMQRAPSPEQLPLLQTLKFSGDNLLALINDILDYSKIRDGKITFERTAFNVHELTERIVHSYEFLCQEKGIRLHYELAPEVPVWVQGDPVRLFQILNNLVGNAVKFTEKGWVQLDIAPATPGGAVLRFTVTDTGIGIAPDRQALIFERFTQASSDTTRKYGGSGLGLAITKDLVELQGGRIQVTSQPGAGAEFVAELPLPAATPPAALPTAPSANQPGLSHLRLLYVEDVPFNQLLIRHFLEPQGIQLDLADEGHTGVAMARAGGYDLILMDIQMPGQDGFETSRQIREFAPAVPIIAVTAMVSEAVREKMAAAGINDYLLKPVDQEALLRKISACTGAAGADTPGSLPIPAASPEPAEVRFALLADIYDQDPVKTARALGLAAQELQAAQINFQTALSRKNAELFARAHHKIKPQLQLLQLTQLAAHLEQCGKSLYQADPQVDAADRENLDQLFEQVLSGIQEQISRLEAAGT